MGRVIILLLTQADIIINCTSYFTSASRNYIWFINKLHLWYYRKIHLSRIVWLNILQYLKFYSTRHINKICCDSNRSWSRWRSVDHRVRLLTINDAFKDATLFARKRDFYFLPTTHAFVHVRQSDRFNRKNLTFI